MLTMKKAKTNEVSEVVLTEKMGNKKKISKADEYTVFEHVNIFTRKENHYGRSKL